MASIKKTKITLHQLFSKISDENAKDIKCKSRIEISRDTKARIIGVQDQMAWFDSLLGSRLSKVILKQSSNLFKTICYIICGFSRICNWIV